MNCDHNKAEELDNGAGSWCGACGSLGRYWIDEVGDRHLKWWPPAAIYARLAAAERVVEAVNACTDPEGLLVTPLGAGPEVDELNSALAALTRYAYATGEGK